MIYSNIAHLVKYIGMKTKWSSVRLYVQICSLCHLGFQILPPTVLKMVSPVDKAKCVLWLHEAESLIAVERSFYWCIERNHCPKIQFVSGINCLMRLVAFVK